MNGRSKTTESLPQWVLNKDPEALLARGRSEYDPASPVSWYPGIALLIGRRGDVEAIIPDVYRLDGQRVSQEQYLEAMNKVQGRSLELLELYVCAGRWEELPPHVPYPGHDLSARSWRLYHTILNAFIARDKKKIAAAIRKADKEGEIYLPYAIVLEARKLGLDPKIKKYDF
jgi:hypothetical protein